MTTAPKLPLLRPYDHPDFVGGMVWTEMEIRAIQSYAQAALLAQAAEPRQNNAVLVPASELRKLQEDAARYLAFFSAGLPVGFLGQVYETKAELDAAIDSALLAEKEAK